MQLLDTDYPGRGGTGSENALLDFLDEPMEVSERIALAIGEGMKRRKRAAYCDRVLVEMLPVDWRKRRKMVFSIREMYGDLLPSEVRNCPTGQLVDSIGELIRSLIDAQGVLSRVLQGRRMGKV